jgi:hypothetical protein
LQHLGGPPASLTPTRTALVKDPNGDASRVGDIEQSRTGSRKGLAITHEETLNPMLASGRSKVDGIYLSAAESQVVDSH